jgi:uncharacterized protein YndB with AHSA1/START domain
LRSNAPGDQDAIDLEALYPHPVELVWRALTEPAALATPMGPEQRWVQVGPKDGETSITLVTWFASMPPGSLKGIVLECDDVQASRDELAARGVTFLQDIEEQPWGTFTTFDDPDGNGWVLSQAPQRR